MCSPAATAGADYVTPTLDQDPGTPGLQVVFQPGEFRVVVPVTIINDTIGEPTETFTVSIQNVDSGSTLLFPRTTRGCGSRP